VNYQLIYYENQSIIIVIYWLMWLASMLSDSMKGIVINFLQNAARQLLDLILDHFVIFMVLSAIISLTWTIDWLSSMAPHEMIILKVKAWKSDSKYLTAQDFPETAALPELQAKPSTAIGFSGGGARAMIGTFGFLAGLRDLGLLDKIRYMGGISGGSWATTVYLYGNFINIDLSQGADESKGSLSPESEQALGEMR
jgi:hypothetical protein